ncbi:MAG: hypothetical protein LQ346_009074 [Caloplaca aetnensis]|nr:MAG: hypothetical protein LQ346_009074 [Caloplaca aetnensis]
MPYYSAISEGILFALTLLPTLVKSYDCQLLANPLDKSCPILPGPKVDYPECLVAKLSVSAFIQCADAKGPDAPHVRDNHGRRERYPHAPPGTNKCSRHTGVQRVSFGRQHHESGPGTRRGADIRGVPMPGAASGGRGDLLLEAMSQWRAAGAFDPGFLRWESG